MTEIQLSHYQLRTLANLIGSEESIDIELTDGDSGFGLYAFVDSDQTDDLTMTYLPVYE